jgi:hypothetical protein
MSTPDFNDDVDAAERIARLPLPTREPATTRRRWAQ